MSGFMDSVWNMISGTEAEKEEEGGEHKKEDSSGGLISFGGSRAYKKQASHYVAEYDYLFKILLIGDSGVGKSSLILRFADNTFMSASYVSTIGVDFKIRQVEVNGKSVKLQIWDTAGQERFRTITSSYYRGAHGIFVCFDLSDIDSLHSVSKWMKEIERYACENISPIILGLKADSAKRIPADVLKKELSQFDCPYCEVCSATGENVEDSFMLLCKNIMGSGKGAPPLLCKAPAPKASPHGIDDDDEDYGDRMCSSDEEFSDNELELDLLDLNDKCDHPKEKKSFNSKNKKHKKINVNVFSLSLASLAKKPELFTGEPIICRSCGVMLSGKSNVSPIPSSSPSASPAPSTPKKEEEKEEEKEEAGEEVQVNEKGNRKKKKEHKYDLVPAPPIHPRFANQSAVDKDLKAEEEDEDALFKWDCEFCGFSNLLSGVDDLEELPQTSTVDYLVTPAPEIGVGEAGNMAGEKGDICPNVVFVVDTSGSMCVTTEIQGKAKLKGAEAREQTFRSLMQEHHEFAGADQYIPGQSHAVTYVSRLQSVQAAIEAQIRHIVSTEPNKKIGLITFNSEVTILGDCSKPPVTIAGDTLNSFDNLLALGDENKLVRPAHDACEDIIKALWALQEEGGTALGPAMILGIAVAGVSPSSQVVVCTDGLANVGIGSLDGEMAQFQAFYVEAGEKAWLKGVSVDVISIIGAECSIENLSIVSEASGGSVERVDPSSLLGSGKKNALESLLGRQLVATNCFAMVLLHKGLQFSGEADDEHDRNWLVRDLGNVSDESSCAFRYIFRGKDEIDLSDVRQVPFQVQLLYVRKDGMQCLRVTTAFVETTDNRADAEASANVSVISTAASNRAALLAKKGDYGEAQMENRAAMRFLQRNKIDANFYAEQVNDLDQILIEEKSRGEKNEPQHQKQQKRADKAAHVISKSKKNKFY